jgi:hypothetical protein
LRHADAVRQNAKRPARSCAALNAPVATGSSCAPFSTRGIAPRLLLEGEFS